MPSKTRTGDLYATIKLPKGFMPQIDEIVSDEQSGFSSRAEVVKQAVREFYIKYKKEKEMLSQKSP